MELKAQKRDITGKKVGSLRRQGLVPGELYGRRVDNLHLSVPAKEFMKVFSQAGENTVVTLNVEGDKRPVLIYGIDYDSLREEYLNIDFYQVRMDEKVTTEVPLEFSGEAPAVREEGGVLVKVLAEVEVAALPGDLPHSLKVDLSALMKIGDSIHIGDLKIPKGVEVKMEPEAVVVTVTGKEEEEAQMLVEAEQIAGVKVESEENRKEEKKEVGSEEEKK